MVNDTIKAIANASTTPTSTTGTGTATDATKTTTPSKNDTISQQQFMTLLVNQLQNQDPLNPMDSQQFATQLAQFSQLEQLVQINQKLDGNSATGGVGSMASYLGHEVALKDQSAFISNGQGPNVVVDFPQDIQSARLDLVDANGKTAGSLSLDGIQPGQQVIPLNGITLPTGSYEVRAKGVNSSGKFVDLDSTITGTVKGFVMEPKPALLVDGEEMDISDVTKVFQGRA